MLYLKYIIINYMNMCHNFWKSETEGVAYELTVRHFFIFLSNKIFFSTNLCIEASMFFKSILSNFQKHNFAWNRWSWSAKELRWQAEEVRILLPLVFSVLQRIPWSWNAFLDLNDLIGCGVSVLPTNFLIKLLSQVV